jgi:flagellar biosynthetic protein FliP
VSFLPLVGALGAVILLIAALAWFARRALGVAPIAGGVADLTVIQRIAVGPRQGIALVRAGSRVIAVSVGDGGVRHLFELDEESAATATAPRPPAAALFGDALRRVIKRGAPAIVAVVLGAATLALPAAAHAQGAAPRVDLNLSGVTSGSGLHLSGSVGIVVLLGMLSLLPTLVLMTTSFTRILIVLHFLRQAIGTQNAPPTQLVAALALVLSGFVMLPTMTRVNHDALTPWLDGKIAQAEMLDRAAVPLREFMLRQTRPADIDRFVRMSGAAAPATVAEVPFVTLMAAFTTSELRTAFTIGFALFLPFIVIDLVTSSVLMSLGMFMLPPATVALPFKLLLFVLVDGWGLVAQSLVTSFR